MTNAKLESLTSDVPIRDNVPYCAQLKVLKTSFLVNITSQCSFTTFLICNNSEIFLDSQEIWKSLEMNNIDLKTSEVHRLLASGINNENSEASVSKLVTITL